MRWAVPTGLGAAVVGLTLVVPAVAASAGTDLPDRTAEQLLSDLQGAEVAAVQGTVLIDADLGIPALPDMGGGGGPYGSDLDLASVLGGQTTLRVWASRDGLRVAALGTMGETDLVTDGEQLWVWSSDDNTVTHLAAPSDDELAAAKAEWLAAHPDATDADLHGRALDHAMASDPRAALAALTPDQLSRMVLDALEPTTDVTTAPATKVAGRPAYQLVLTPKDAGTLVGSVTIAIDAAERVPTRVTVTSTATGEPALTVGYSDVSFTPPDPSVYAFTPPAGASVEEVDPLSADGRAGVDAPGALQGGPTTGGEPQVVGKGWASVLVLPALQLAGATVPQAEGSAEPGALAGLLAAMPQVSGDWGSGRLLSTHLFTVLMTDDGRTLVGAVDRATLEAAASAAR